MFSSLGWQEIVVLVLVALFIFGPDRLPGAAKQAGSALKSLKEQVTGAKKHIKEEFGDELPNFDRDLLNPREYVRKHLWEDDEPAVSKPTPRGMKATQQLQQTQQPAKFDLEAT
ncbi:MAG: sec-independent translocase [Cumulibacter sp.]